MSYYNDHDKYGDFFNSYSPEKQRKTPSRPPREPSQRPKQNKKRRKRKSISPIKLIIVLTAFLLTAVFIATAVSKCNGNNASSDNSSAESHSSISSAEIGTPADATPVFTVKRPVSTDKTFTLGAEIESPYAVLVDCSNDTVLARRNADTKIYPASMTKVMTLLIAAENIKDTEATMEMTSKIIDPLYKEGLTLAGFGPGEQVKLVDLFYGMVLESGAECSVALAEYVAGSEAEFVKMMNGKCAELGLKSTNFTNTSGLHDNNHYTTAVEMAMIMRAAIDNDFCRRIMSTEWYTVPANQYHQELKFHSGMYEKMYGTEPKVATIKGGKTGYTHVSLYCLVSFAITDDGREIICVTAKGERKYAPVYDCIELYKTYTHPN